MIPPCVDYHYYAVTPTILAGRYFWNYASMHLTEAAKTRVQSQDSTYPYVSVDAGDWHTTLCRMLSILPCTDFSRTSPARTAPWG